MFFHNPFLCAFIYTCEQLLECLQSILRAPSRVHQRYLPYYNVVEFLVILDFNPVVGILIYRESKVYFIVVYDVIVEIRP